MGGLKYRRATKDSKFYQGNQHSRLRGNKNKKEKITFQISCMNSVYQYDIGCLERIKSNK